MEAGFLGSGVGASGVRKDKRRKVIHTKKSSRDRVKRGRWVEDNLEKMGKIWRSLKGSRENKVLSVKTKETIKARKLALG